MSVRKMARSLPSRRVDQASQQPFQEDSMKLSKLIASVFAILGLAATTTVEAGPTLAFSIDGGSFTYCADGNATCDLSATAGVVSFSGAIGAFDVNITTGVGRS